MPTGVKWATVAPAVPVAAGVVAMASGLLMWWDVAYAIRVSMWSVWLSVAPAGAAALVAVAGLALTGRARWLRYVQIGLWLLALASSVYIVNACAQVTGPGPSLVLLALGDISGVVTVVLLARGLRRPASRQPRWRLAPVLLAAALACIAAGLGATCHAYGPGYGIMTGIVGKCTLAEDTASGQAPASSRVVTVYVQNDAGHTVASQRLPLRTSGARYRLRLLRGTYSIGVASSQGDGDGAEVYVPADMTNEVDFDDATILWCVR